MQASPLLDTESDVTCGQADLPASSPALTVRTVPSSMRQLSVTFRPTQGAEGAATSTEPILLHIHFQGFVDALWVLVTEDATCAPGVVLCNDGMPEELRAGTFFKFNGETPSVECDILLGLRDHPLTNLVASTIAHAIRKFGEARALIMCLSVVQAGKTLKSTEDKKAFLMLIREAVMDLAQGGGESMQ